MVVDEAKLTERLVEKTGMPRDEVAQALGQLKKRLQGVTETGKPFEISHFGTFKEQDGQLQFDPDDRLATEINQKYAGMEPVELIEAFKETGANIPVEKEPEPKEIDEPEKEQQHAAPAEITEPAEEKTEAEPEEQVDKPEPDDEEIKSPQEPAETEPEPVAETHKNKRPTKKAPPRMKESGSHPLTKVAAMLLLIGVLGAAGWLVYQNSASKRSSIAVNGAPGDSTGHRQAQKKEQGMLSADSVGRRSAMAEQKKETNVSNHKQHGAPKETSRYGLQGSTNDQLKNAYTIVIHSFRLKSTVKDIADSLSQAGYRTVLFSGTANDQTRWRLGLGQFKHVDKAQTAAQRLSEPYQSNHFIKRYHLK